MFFKTQFHHFVHFLPNKFLFRLLLIHNYPIDTFTPQHNDNVYQHPQKRPTRGVVAAKLDFKQPTHQQIKTPTIYVCMVMKGLCSKKLAKRTYSWGWAYWTLNDKGIEYVREQLHLPAETTPNTFRKMEAQPTPQAFRSSGPATRGRGGARTFGDRDNKDFKPRGDGERQTRGGRGGRGRGAARTERAERAPRTEKA